MAQKTVVHLIDDLDGGEAIETIGFALDERRYEIDLNAANAAQLRNCLERFIDGGRPVSMQKRTTVRPKRDQSAKVRAWAREQGLAVRDRGRIPDEIQKRFDREMS